MTTHHSAIFAPPDGDRRRDAPTEPPPTMEALARWIHQGSKLLRAGDPARARDILERAASLSPRDAKARHLLALASLQLGQFEPARALYEALVREYPADDAAKINLAVVALKMGVAADARLLLEEVVRARPAHRRAWGYLGVALEQLGEIAGAETALIAGHFTSAANRLRDRHPSASASGALVPERTSGAAGAIPSHPRRTLAAGPWTGPETTVSGSLAYASLSKFTATLRPPDFGAAEHRPTFSVSPPDSSQDPIEEIAFEQTVAFAPAIAPPPPSHAPKPNRPVMPLLDAALSSLLVVPHESVVVAHATGLVLVGLVEAASETEGGFAARADVVHAFAGELRQQVLPQRPMPAPSPFRDAPFVRATGTGQLVLAPPRGARLLPLDMDADVAFIREELIVAFDYALLHDLGRLRKPSGEPLALVRFRGDGVIVLGLDSPFLAFDVRGDETLTLRTDALIGWVGLLAPEPTADRDDLLTFGGEGTVLFRAPQAS